MTAEDSPPDGSRHLDALDEALRLLNEDALDAGAFRRRFPDHADDVFRDLEPLLKLDHLGGKALGLSSGLPAAVVQPDRLGEFEIIGELGRGGMGVVYEARQPGLDRTVAVKMLPPGFTSTPAIRDRFEREAALAARITHPAIVRVYSFGEEGGVLYIAMERIDGASLHAVLAAMEERTREAFFESVGGRPPSGAIGGLRGYVDLIVEAGIAVSDALRVAHAEGLIHRDVKPGNVLFDRSGAPHLADFGLARQTDSASLTASGHLLGTPAYMAPECIKGERAGASSDIFSLGVMLYEALTRRAPFEAATSAATIHRVLHHDPPPIDRADPRLPADLANVIQRAIEKEPAQRYVDAAALRDDLVRFREGEAVHASRVGAVGHLWRRVRRRPITSAVGVVAGLVLVGAVIFAAIGAINRASERRVQVARLLGRGQALEKEARLEAARSVYREAASLDGRHDGVRASLDRVEAALWRYRRDRLFNELLVEIARPFLDRLMPEGILEALGPSKDDRTACVARVFESMLRGANDEAIAWLDRAAIHGDGIGLGILRVRCLKALGRTDEVGRLERKLRSREPTHLEGYCLRAMKEGTARGVALLRRAERRFPEAEAIPVLHGLLAESSMRHPEAVRLFSRAIMLNEGFLRAYVCRGFARLPTSVSEFKGAREDFEHVLAAAPDCASAIEGLARVLCARSESRPEGIALLDRAVEQYPKQGTLRMCRGQLLMLDRRFDEAAADLDRAIALGDNRARHARVNLELRRGREPAALALVEKLLAEPGIEPHHRIELLTIRAGLRVATEPQKAAGDYREALAIRRDPRAVEGLAALNLRAGNFAVAEALCTELIEGGFGGSYAVIRRGACRLMRLDVRGAKEDFDRAVAVRKDRVVLHRLPWARDAECSIEAALGNYRAALRGLATLDGRAKNTVRAMRWSFSLRGLEGLERAIARRNEEQTPELTFARAWIAGARGRWDEVTEVDTAESHVLGVMSVHVRMLRWGADSKTPVKVREVLSATLCGESTRDRLVALGEIERDEHEALRQYLIGQAWLRAGDSTRAGSHFERASQALTDFRLTLDRAIVAAKAGDGVRAAALFKRALAGIVREDAIELAYRAGVGPGLAPLDRCLGGDSRGL